MKRIHCICGNCLTDYSHSTHLFITVIVMVKGYDFTVYKFANTPEKIS